MQEMSPNKSTSPNTYSTSDLGVAVFLFTRGHELVKTELETPRRLCFFFLKTAETERLVLRYLSGKAEAPALNLFQNYKTLRAITFEKTNNLRRSQGAI